MDLRLGQALPRRRGDDPRRLPARHQGEADRDRPRRADGADGVPPQPAERHLPRRLLQRHRQPVGLRRLQHQPRPHGQPRQLDPRRRHSAAGADQGARRGHRHRRRRLLRRRPLRAALRHPRSRRPRLALSAGRRIILLSAEDTTTQTTAPSPSSGTCSRAIRPRSKSNPPRTAAARRSPSTGTTPSGSPRTTR